LLVDFFSAEEMCDCIHQVLEHPNRMQQMRDKARQTIVTRYDLKRICLPQQLELIQTLLSR
jgi:glycosyltransferase involved in cell wall biosynthesis